MSIAVRLLVAPASRREQINAEGVTKQGYFREPEKESEWCAPLARLMLPAGRRGYLKKPPIIWDFSHKPNSNGQGRLWLLAPPELVFSCVFDWIPAFAGMTPTCR